MIRSRRQNFASLPQALSSDSANTHWNLSATMLSCPWSIWDSFRGIQSHTHNWSFGWITIKIHNKIKYLKVPTYVRLLEICRDKFDFESNIFNMTDAEEKEFNSLWKSIVEGLMWSPGTLIYIPNEAERKAAKVFIDVIWKNEDTDDIFDEITGGGYSGLLVN